MMANITGASNRRKPSYYSAELKQRLAAVASQPGSVLSTIAQKQGEHKKVWGNPPNFSH